MPIARIGGIILGVIVLVCLGSGIYIVNPGEVAIVRTFGNWNGDQQTEGLHWHIPWPIERQDVVSIQRVQNMELGFRSVGEIGSGEGLVERGSEARMITGDENLVDVQLVVQYRVRDRRRVPLQRQGPIRDRTAGRRNIARRHRVRVEASCGTAPH